MSDFAAKRSNDNDLNFKWKRPSDKDLVGLTGSRWKMLIQHMLLLTGLASRKTQNRNNSRETAPRRRAVESNSKQK